MTNAMTPQPGPPERRTTRRAAVYLRVGLGHTGEGLAAERQREDAEQLAAARGWHVVDLYVDTSVSASKSNVFHPEYARLLADYRAGRFDALICYDLDRLTHKRRELEEWIDEAEQRGLALITMNGEADLTTDAGLLFARIKVAVAKAETDRKGAIQRRASRRRIERGKPPIGPRLYGYGRDGVTVLPDESSVVAELFERFAAGATIKGLVDDLNGRGLTNSRGVPWLRSTVRDMLRNPRYAGMTAYQGGRTGTRGEWDALVSEALFDAVQARLSDPGRVKFRAGNERKRLGSGRYRCGLCDAKVVTNGFSYVCPTGHLSRAIHLIDGYIEAKLLAFLGSREFAELRDAATIDNAELNRLNAATAELSTRLESIVADYDAGFIDGRRFHIASEKVQADLEAATRERSALLTRSTWSVVLNAPHPVDAYRAASIGERRDALDAVMEVRLLRGKSGRGPVDPLTGRRSADPASVDIEWKGLA